MLGCFAKAKSYEIMVNTTEVGATLARVSVTVFIAHHG
jgi:hypothetical protein